MLSWTTLSTNPRYATGGQLKGWLRLIKCLIKYTAGKDAPFFFPFMPNLNINRVSITHVLSLIS